MYMRNCLLAMLVLILVVLMLILLLLNLNTIYAVANTDFFVTELRICSVEVMQHHSRGKCFGVRVWSPGWGEGYCMGKRCRNFIYYSSKVYTDNIYGFRICSVIYTQVIVNLFVITYLWMFIIYLLVCYYLFDYCYDQFVIRWLRALS